MGKGSAFALTMPDQKMLHLIRCFAAVGHQESKRASALLTFPLSGQKLSSERREFLRNKIVALHQCSQARRTRGEAFSFRSGDLTFKVQLSLAKQRTHLEKLIAGQAVWNANSLL